MVTFSGQPSIIFFLFLGTSSILATKSGNSKKARRNRRGLKEDIFQENVYGLAHILLPDLVTEPKTTLAFVLVYLPYNKRSSTWDRYRVGVSLNDASQNEILLASSEAIHA